jgi:hypothetical protein
MRQVIVSGQISNGWWAKWAHPPHLNLLPQREKRLEKGSIILRSPFDKLRVSGWFYRPPIPASYETGHRERRAEYMTLLTGYSVSDILQPDGAIFFFTLDLHMTAYRRK